MDVRSVEPVPDPEGDLPRPPDVLRLGAVDDATLPRQSGVLLWLLFYHSFATNFFDRF